MRFTRLRLTNWRNFREAEVALAPRAFFIGPSASGKSNLLDAVRFLRDLVRPTGGGLSAALAERGGLSAIRCLEARRTPYVEIDVDVGDDENPQRWSYRLRINRMGKEPFATVQEEEVRRDGRRIEILERPKDAKDALEYSQTWIEQVGKNRAFRELADFFLSIRYTHVVPQIVRDAGRAKREGEDPYGGDLLRRMKEMPKKSRDPKLRRIGDALKVAVPQFKDLELRDDQEGRPHLYADYAHWRPRASKQSEELFSDGTLRLIGFLWAITEKGGPLLLEEPELSLHDSVVTQLSQMIARAQRLSKRQVLASTHSYALLDSPGIGLNEVHRLIVGKNGTRIETASDNEKVRALVDTGWTVGAAAMPLAKPEGIDRLGHLDVAG